MERGGVRWKWGGDGERATIVYGTKSSSSCCWSC